MRIVIAVGIAILIAYGYHSFATEEANSQLPIAIVMGLETLLTGIALVGVDIPKYPRTITLIRATCLVGIVVFLVLNAVYAFVGVNTSFYVINGIVFMIMLLIINSIPVGGIKSSKLIQ